MKSIQTKFIILILGCVMLSSAVIGGAGVLSAKKVVDEESASAVKKPVNSTVSSHASNSR